MIDTEKEDCFVLSDSPKRLGKHPNTVRRYINEGKEVDGKRVYLESVPFPEGIATSIQAYHRFIRALDEARQNGRRINDPDDI